MDVAGGGTCIARIIRAKYGRIYINYMRFEGGQPASPLDFKFDFDRIGYVCVSVADFCMCHEFIKKNRKEEARDQEVRQYWIMVYRLEKRC